MSEIPVESKLSRRNFLKLAGGLTLGAMAVKYDAVLSLLASNELQSSIDEAKLFLREAYGLNAIVGPDPASPNITGEIPNTYEQARGL